MSNVVSKKELAQVLNSHSLSVLDKKSPKLKEADITDDMLKSFNDGIAEFEKKHKDFDLKGGSEDYNGEVDDAFLQFLQMWGKKFDMDFLGECLENRNAYLPMELEDYVAYHAGPHFHDVMESISIECGVNGREFLTKQELSQVLESHDMKLATFDQLHAYMAGKRKLFESSCAVGETYIIEEDKKQFKFSVEEIDDEAGEIKAKGEDGKPYKIKKDKFDKAVADGNCKKYEGKIMESALLSGDSITELNNNGKAVLENGDKVSVNNGGTFDYQSGDKVYRLGSIEDLTNFINENGKDKIKSRTFTLDEKLSTERKQTLFLDSNGIEAWSDDDNLLLEKKEDATNEECATAAGNILSRLAAKYSEVSFAITHDELNEQLVIEGINGNRHNEHGVAAHLAGKKVLVLADELCQYKSQGVELLDKIATDVLEAVAAGKNFERDNSVSLKQLIGAWSEEKREKVAEEFGISSSAESLTHFFTVMAEPEEIEKHFSEHVKADVVAESVEDLATQAINGKLKATHKCKLNIVGNGHTLLKKGERVHYNKKEEAIIQIDGRMIGQIIDVTDEDVDKHLEPLTTNESFNLGQYLTRYDISTREGIDNVKFLLEHYAGVKKKLLENSKSVTTSADYTSEGKIKISSIKNILTERILSDLNFACFDNKTDKNKFTKKLVGVINQSVGLMPLVAKIDDIKKIIEENDSWCTDNETDVKALVTAIAKTLEETANEEKHPLGDLFVDRPSKNVNDFKVFDQLVDLLKEKFKASKDYNISAASSLWLIGDVKDDAEVKALLSKLGKYTKVYEAKNNEWTDEEEDALSDAGYKFNGNDAYHSYPRTGKDGDYDEEVYISKTGAGYVISFPGSDDKKDITVKKFYDLIEKIKAGPIDECKAGDTIKDPFGENVEVIAVGTWDEIKDYHTVELDRLLRKGDVDEKGQFVVVEDNQGVIAVYQQKDISSINENQAAYDLTRYKKMAVSTVKEKAKTDEENNSYYEELIQSIRGAYDIVELDAILGETDFDVDDIRGKAGINDSEEVSEGEDEMTPAKLGTTLKKLFKTKWKLDIGTRYIKTVRGLDGSWYEISTFNSKQEIPNEIRKQALILQRGEKALNDVRNPNDIVYGNIEKFRIAIYGKDWKKFIADNTDKAEEGKDDVDTSADYMHYKDVIDRYLPDAKIIGIDSDDATGDGDIDIDLGDDGYAISIKFNQDKSIDEDVEVVVKISGAMQEKTTITCNAQEFPDKMGEWLKSKLVADKTDENKDTPEGYDGVDYDKVGAYLQENENNLKPTWLNDECLVMAKPGNMDEEDYLKISNLRYIFKLDWKTGKATFNDKITKELVGPTLLAKLKGEMEALVKACATKPVKEAKEKAKFCKCNNCGKVFIDTNPGDQPEFEVDNINEYEELPWIKERSEEDESEEEVRGCDKCNTDGYLQDVTDEKDLAQPVKENISEDEPITYNVVVGKTEDGETLQIFDDEGKEIWSADPAEVDEYVEDGHISDANDIEGLQTMLRDNGIINYNDILRKSRATNEGGGAGVEFETEKIDYSPFKTEEKDGKYTSTAKDVKGIILSSYMNRKKTEGDNGELSISFTKSELEHAIKEDGKFDDDEIVLEDINNVNVANWGKLIHSRGYIRSKVDAGDVLTFPNCELEIEVKLENGEYTTVTLEKDVDITVSDDLAMNYADIDEEDDYDGDDPGTDDDSDKTDEGLNEAKADTLYTVKTETRGGSYRYRTGTLQEIVDANSYPLEVHASHANKPIKTKGFKTIQAFISAHSKAIDHNNGSSYYRPYLYLVEEGEKGYGFTGSQAELDKKDEKPADTNEMAKLERARFSINKDAFDQQEKLASSHPDIKINIVDQNTVSVAWPVKRYSKEQVIKLLNENLKNGVVNEEEMPEEKTITVTYSEPTDSIAKQLDLENPQEDAAKTTVIAYVRSEAVKNFGKKAEIGTVSLAGIDDDGVMNFNIDVTAPLDLLKKHAGEGKDFEYEWDELLDENLELPALDLEGLNINEAVSWKTFTPDDIDTSASLINAMAMTVDNADADALKKLTDDFVKKQDPKGEISLSDAVKKAGMSQASALFKSLRKFKYDYTDELWKSLEKTAVSSNESLELPVLENTDEEIDPDEIYKQFYEEGSKLALSIKNMPVNSTTEKILAKIDKLIEDKGYLSEQTVYDALSSEDRDYLKDVNENKSPLFEAKKNGFSEKVSKYLTGLSKGEHGGGWVGHAARKTKDDDAVVEAALRKKGLNDKEIAAFVIAKDGRKLGDEYEEDKTLSYLNSKDQDKYIKQHKKSVADGDFDMDLYESVFTRDGLTGFILESSETSTTIYGTDGKIHRLDEEWKNIAPHVGKGEKYQMKDGKTVHKHFNDFTEQEKMELTERGFKETIKDKIYTKGKWSIRKKDGKLYVKNIDADAEPIVFTSDAKGLNGAIRAAGAA